MKGTDKRGGFSQNHAVISARALIIAGFLFCAVRGSAQLLPPGYTGGPTNTPIDSWSFNDSVNWTDDNGNAPISFTNLDFSDLGNGASLVVDTNIPAWLQYYIYEPRSGATNLILGGGGSVTFWYGPSWSSTNAGGTGPGDWAQLLDIGEWTDDASYGYWGLSVDPAGANLYFAAQDGSGDSYVLSAPISWTTNYFHFVALTYSGANVSLYLDGVLATNDPGGLSVWPGTNVLAGGVYFGSATNGGMQAQGMFNTVETYSYPLNSNDVKQIFDWNYGRYIISPLNMAMSQILSGPSSPSYTPTYDVISGQGSLLWVSNTATCSYGTNAYNIWIADEVVTRAGNGTENVKFSIQGGADYVPYDVFANSVVSFGPNGMSWKWMGQGYHCNTYMLTNLPADCFLILGTPYDSSDSGLTDAYELLVLKTDPHGAQTDGYGVPFAWYAMNGLTPNNGGATQDPDQDGLLNWQEYQYGTRPTVSEGFAIWVSTPNGTTSIP